MGQFSVTILAFAGSILSGNQQVKTIWILVLVGHILMFLAVLGQLAFLLVSGSKIDPEWEAIALFVGIWGLYLVAILGSRVKGDTLLGLTIEARKAELRKRIRELQKAE